MLTILAPRWRQFWLLVGFIFALCSLLSGLSVLQVYICDADLDRRTALGSLIHQEFKDWYAIGLVSLGVIGFARRHALKPGATGRWVSIHFGAATAFGAVYALFTSWLVAGERSVMHPGQILTFEYLLRTYWVHYVLLFLIVYWLVVFAHLGWHYYQRYREHEMRSVQLQNELVEAKLQALRMQLNPHFLFNTLHAISALIHENPQAADRVLARLSELLRLSLDQTKPQEVPLSEEMAFLDRYLDIEQTRFAERLTIEKDIQPETQSALVPYLILQPLVENAIRHGIEPREEPGVLSIRATRKNGHLELTVRDNGTGLPLKSQSSDSTGIGLANTRSRLRHLYGDNWQFELSPAEGGGLEARIEIPFRAAEPSPEQEFGR